MARKQTVEAQEGHLKEVTIKVFISELEKLFDLLNDHLFERALSRPVITIMQDTKRGAYSVLGWCTTYEAWQDASGQGCHEINICAEHLNRPYEDIAETMLHEMVHLLNVQLGIKDTSRNGTYHNKEYKKAAETHGLTVAKDAKYGWTITKLCTDVRDFLLNNKTTSFDLFRIPESRFKGKKSSTRKYICPECGLSVRATKEVFVICGECELTMALAETEDDG